MRLAFKGQQMLYSNGFYGVNLGYDFCAEHEWGIDRINQIFGINNDEEIYGIEKRLIHKIPDYLSLDKRKDFFYLTCTRSKEFIIKEYHDYQKSFKRNLITGWCDASFCICTNAQEIEELYEAFQKLDVAIGVGKALNPFGSGGLVIVIASKMPELDKELLYQEDKAWHELNVEAKQTGIYELLKSKNKYYYCLEPERQSDNSIRWWLNPQEQQKYNSMWCTLKDLQDWAEDKGAVMKC